LGEITGDFAKGVKAASQVLAVSGRVLPVTIDPVGLEAELKDGSIITGESSIGKVHQDINQLRLVPPNVSPAPETREAIAEADAIIIGPGSLYTSILPNLLVNGIAEEIAASRAVKIYVCNVMTQPGETDHMTASDHVNIIRNHTRPDLLQYIIANTELPRSELLERYQKMKAEPIVIQDNDLAKFDEWGLTLIKSGCSPTTNLAVCTSSLANPPWVVTTI